MPLTAYQLRFCPARYIHESHLPAVLLRLLPALPDWRRQSVLNAWLLEQLELDCAFRMPAQLGGLALYPQAALERTLGWLGALLHGQALRQVLDGARVRRIRAQIGEQGQRFCLEQLDLLIGRWPPGWQRALPETRKKAISGAAAWLSGWPPVAMPTAVSRGACACAWRPCRPRRTGPSTNNGDPWRGPCA